MASSTPGSDPFSASNPLLDAGQRKLNGAAGGIGGGSAAAAMEQRGGGNNGSRSARSPAAAAAPGGRGLAIKPPRRTQPFMIMPDSQFHLTWIQVRVVVALYIVWITPVRVGFALPAEGAWFWLELAIDLFFAVDVALNFLTAYEDEHTGEVVVCRRRVARRYLRGWFAVDLLASLPVEPAVRAAERSWSCSVRADCLWGLATESALAEAARALRGLRVFRVAWIARRLRHMRAAHLFGALADDLYLAVAPFLSIAEPFVVLLYLGHACGCFFYMFSGSAWQTVGERRLVAAGLMEPWARRAFAGAERLVMPPQACGGGEGGGGISSSLLGAHGGSVWRDDSDAWNGATLASSPPPGNASGFALPPSLFVGLPASSPLPLPPPLCLSIASVSLEAGPPPDPFPLIALDQEQGQWYACPGHGYSIVECPPCSGGSASANPSSSSSAFAATTTPTTTRCCREMPPFRCRALFRLPYRYVTSVYWAIVTMATVGYGDIAPATIGEKLMTTATIVLAGFFFSFVIGRVASAVSKLDAQGAAAEERLAAARALARDAGLPRALSKKVLDHLKKQRVTAYDRDGVLRSLPFTLRAPVLRHLYGRAVKGVPLLARLAREAGEGGGGGTGRARRQEQPPDGRGGGSSAGSGGGSDAELFLTDVCSRLQPYHVPAQSHVYQRGEAGGDLFVLLHGELHLVVVAGLAGAGQTNAAIASPSSPSSLRLSLRIPEGSIFGEGAALKALEAVAVGVSTGAAAAAAALAAGASAAAASAAAAAAAQRPRREEAVYATTAASLLRVAQEDAVDLCLLHPRLADALERLQRARAGEVAALAARQQQEQQAAAVAAAAAASGPAAATTTAARSSGDVLATGPQLLRDLLRRMGAASTMAGPGVVGAAAAAAAAGAAGEPQPLTTATPARRQSDRQFRLSLDSWGLLQARAGGGNHHHHHHHHHHHESEPLLPMDATAEEEEEEQQRAGGGGDGGGGMRPAPALLLRASTASADGNFAFLPEIRQQEEEVEEVVEQQQQQQQQLAASAGEDASGAPPTATITAPAAAAAAAAEAATAAASEAMAAVRAMTEEMARLRAALEAAGGGGGGGGGGMLQG